MTRGKTPRGEDWVRVTPAGLYIEPGDFYVDPARPVDRAVITHGHADHARPNHRAVLATPETLAIMRARYSEAAGGSLQALPYRQPMTLNGVTVEAVPAGHVLGAAQIVLTWQGCRVTVSGDYKRRSDPTCKPFEVVTSDVFITEATFGLPVFHHPPAEAEIARLLHIRTLNPDRAVVLGVYALGKAQRVIALLRGAGYDRPIYVHGALQALCQLYEDQGVRLGPLLPATGRDKAAFEGEIVLAPPSAIADRWARRLPDPLVAAASGWMRVRQRAKQRGVELPLIISDHADWGELVTTIQDVQADEIWVTHGREEALVRQAELLGLKARALRLVGREEEGEDAA